MTTYSVVAKDWYVRQAAIAYWSEADGRSLSAVKGLFMAVTARSSISDNTASAIAYFTFIPAFLFLLLPPYKQSNYVRFHAWQSVLLDVAAFMIEIVVGAIALLTLFLGAVAVAYVLRAISVLWLILWLACLIQAMRGKRFKVPLLGNIAEKLAMK